MRRVVVLLALAALAASCGGASGPSGETTQPTTTGSAPASSMPLIVYAVKGGKLAAERCGASRDCERRDVEAELVQCRPCDSARARDEHLFAPPIVVVEPQPGDAVTSPVRVHGSADAFEATFQIEIVDAGGAVVARSTVTASAGSGERGSYDVSIRFEGAKAGPGKIVAYEDSAENGQRIHIAETPVVLS